MPAPTHILAPATPLAVALADLPVQFGQIFYTIVLPMLLIVALGFLLERKLKLDLYTLTRLNFYYVIPPVIFLSVVNAKVSAGEAGRAVGFTVALSAAIAAVTLLIARLRRVPRDQRNAMTLTTISYNSGNYGLPLQEMAFGAIGLSLQSFVMITQNVMNFTVGVLLAASGRRDRHWRQNLLHIAKFPPLYALALALLTVQVRQWLSPGQIEQLAPALAPLVKVISYGRDAFIAVALFTLGAQLAMVRAAPTRYPVSLSVALRLLVAPALGLGLVHLLGLSGLLAQVMLVSTATPTAVNSMLLCMEFDNHPNYVARAVFYSTLISPVTVTLVIFYARNLL